MTIIKIRKLVQRENTFFTYSFFINKRDLKIFFITQSYTLSLELSIQNNTWEFDLNSFRKNSAEKGQIFKILNCDPGQRCRTFYSPLLKRKSWLTMPINVYPLHLKPKSKKGKKKSNFDRHLLYGELIPWNLEGESQNLRLGYISLHKMNLYSIFWQD